eukprot:COSAG05_NODE_1420_length_4927_cov_7.611226_2_plen_58_part_00
MVVHVGASNELLVKAMQPSWAAPWEMALSLGQVASSSGATAPAPIPGLRSSPCTGSV